MEVTSGGTLTEQEADDIPTCFCNVDDIAEKAETQIKVVIFHQMVRFHFGNRLINRRNFNFCIMPGTE